MLVAEYKVGSALLLDNPQDMDILRVYETEQEMKQARKENKDHSKDYHFSYVEKEQNRMFLGIYIRHFMELISGSELDCVKNYKFIDHKAEYTEFVRKFLRAQFPKFHKQWYHIYLAYVFFNKGRMVLNKTEKAKAQEIHDNGIDNEMYKILFEYFSDIF